MQDVLHTGNLDKAGDYDLKAVGEQMRDSLNPSAEGEYGGGGGYGADEKTEPAEGGEAPAPAPAPTDGVGGPTSETKPLAEDDPMKAMQEALGRK